MPTAYISHSVCAKHDMGEGHPECPARLAAVEDALRSDKLLDELVQVNAEQAPLETIALAHDTALIDRIIAASPECGLSQLDPDTAMNSYSLEAARRAAGALIQATDMVMSGDVDNAFCNVRPPGHHAERDRSMGFCLFNNVAIAALYAIEKYALERVAVVDFDVHHGNGTENILQGNEKTLFCSTFQHPYYPGSYLPLVDGHRVNVPLAAGSDGQAFREAVTSNWLPALREFSPQFLFISAGFDAHREDQLAGLNLNDDDYAWITDELCDVARETAQGRIVSTLEGGYALAALGRSASQHVARLLDSATL